MAAAGTITNVPLSGDDGKSAITPEGYVPQPGESLHGHYFYSITGDYFSALGIPLREGRLLTSADSHRPDRVCVVDEDFCAALLAERRRARSTCISRHRFRRCQLFTIVGIVGSVKQADLTEPRGQGAVYVPYRYREGANIFVVTRTSQRPDAFADALRQLIRATDPELAIDDIRSMDTRIAESLIGRRSPAMLAGIVAGVALLLAAIGTYGVLSYTIAQRRREIGIRMALGAQTGQIRTQFLSLGLRLLAAGLLLGLMGAWVAGKAMQSVLFGVPTLHLATLFGTALVMGAVSLVACFIPARRASRVDPMIALRAE